jgi:hypothetical protein
MDKLINRRYVDPSLPGIAYQLAHGRGQGDPRMIEGWIAKPKTKTKPSRYDWGFNHG